MTTDDGVDVERIASSTIPPLPPKLKFLIIDRHYPNNKEIYITIQGKIPASMEKLRLIMGVMPDLSELPPNLTELNVSGNKKLPSSLPRHLNYVSLDYLMYD